MNNEIKNISLKIIITKTFLKEYEKILNKNKINNVISKIKQKLGNDLIYLKRPILKIKFNLENISIRLVGKYIENQLLFFPIFIYKKTDKNNGYNIIWKNIESKIIEKMKKIDLDLNNGNFEVFE